MAGPRLESPPAGFPGSRAGAQGGGGPGGPRWAQVKVRPKEGGRTLVRLWKGLRQERLQLSGIFVLVLLSGAVALGAPRLIGLSVDAMGRAGPSGAGTSAILAAALGLLLAYGADALSSLGQGWLMAGVSQRFVLGMRKSLFSKLHRLPVVFFDTHSHGDLMSRLANDIDNISGTVSQSTTQLMSTGINLLGSLVMMLVLSPALTLASLVTVPLVFLLTRRISGRTRVLFKEQQVALGLLNGHIEESVSGMQVVKAFGREDAACLEFEALNAALRDVGTKAQIWSGYIMPLMNVINNVGFAAVAIVGGVLAARGEISVGLIASFISYARQFTRPLNDLANVYNALQTALAGAERVFEIMDEAEEEADAEGALALGRPAGRVEFRQVDFGYRADRPILKQVSFDAAPGSVTALVGPTGAGKTTIVNLIARFYDPGSGHILLDGVDLRGFSRRSLRRGLGIVLQDGWLFSGSLRDNILYGRPGASTRDLEAAAAMANAEHFIHRLPRGYDTPIGEGGLSLSEGQRQLVSIARVILADPAILVLDEATSSVDTRTELHIQEALIALMRGRTSFIVAHRLSTIRAADTILVVEGGRIVESGSHAGLAAAGGLYARMFESQV
jgi:ATP-binding cassette, subfamily B, multidrug efflux pump